MTTIKEFQGYYRFLSNFYDLPRPIMVARLEFRTAEHLYQALKTNDLVEITNVAHCATPGQAKRMGSTLVLRDDWEDVKVRAMEIVVARKFLANTDLLQLLLNTQDDTLVEGNTWHDNFWGHCYCEKCEDKFHSNTLGTILMNFRDNIQDWTKLDIF